MENLSGPDRETHDSILAVGPGGTITRVPGHHIMAPVADPEGDPGVHRNPPFGYT